VPASEPQLIQRTQQPPALAGTRTRKPRPWQNYLLGLACVAAIVAAYELVGPTTSSPSTEIRLVTVERGVVQASESASGNLAPESEADLNFKASGILTGLYVQAGQHVQKGQLLAAIDSSSASVALEQAEASLEAAQAKLAATEANPSGASSVGGSSTGTGASAAAVYGPTGPSGASGASSTSGASGASGASGGTGDTGSGAATSTAQTTKPAGKKTSTTTSTSSAVTQATDAANLASAQAAVSSAELTVKSDKAALAGTKLYAPSAGTIASISGAVGDEVTAGTGGSSATGASDASSTGSGASALGAASTSASNSSSTSSSGSGFIVLANLSAMQLVVSVSESDIGSVKVGQPATISVDALPNEEFAAKVTAISLLSSDSSGVISYSVTIKLTQNSKQLLPGMTATATIITGQANDAVNVESAAISSVGTRSTVTVDNNGKMVVTPVITGLVGASTTQIVAGVTPGEELAIPIATGIATSTATTGSGTLGSGSGGFGAGALSGLGGGGFARFSRGGG
jgi:multidrug efflux pump subunit AcrA (membrane-fusion protein)